MEREKRPCLVKRDGKRAIFHRWAEVSQIVPPALTVGGHGGGVVKDVMALVELEGGDVCMVHASEIRFLDSERHFVQFNFGEEGEG